VGTGFPHQALIGQGDWLATFDNRFGNAGAPENARLEPEQHVVRPYRADWQVGQMPQILRQIGLLEQTRYEGHASILLFESGRSRALGRLNGNRKIRVEL